MNLNAQNAIFLNVMKKKYALFIIMIDLNKYQISRTFHVFSKVTSTTQNTYCLYITCTLSAHLILNTAI